jgi:hypothetical protein
MFAEGQAAEPRAQNDDVKFSVFSHTDSFRQMRKNATRLVSIEKIG